MTAPTQSAPDITQDHFRQAAQAGQDAMDTAIRVWGKTWQQFPWQQFMGVGGESPRQVPNTDELIDTWFDITGELLVAQREFTKALLGLSQPGLAVAIGAAQQAATMTQQVTEQASGAARQINSAGRKNT
jgi:hypothetical protein